MVCRASPHSSLPADAIAAGAHVSLDVRGRVLRIAKAIPDPSALAVVHCEVYELRDMDAALLLFEYLEAHRSRFRSVKIV